MISDEGATAIAGLVNLTSLDLGGKHTKNAPFHSYMYLFLLRHRRVFDTAVPWHGLI